MNQHDETRKILNLIRENRKKPILGKTILKEQDFKVQEEKGELDPTEVKEEEKK